VIQPIKEDVAMLVLSRKCGESIVIDGRIRITIAHVGGSAVRLAIDAPRDVLVLRSELVTGDSSADAALPLAALPATAF
jgi:carbon storage regulator